MTREVGWVIERNHDGALQYWNGSHAGHAGWTTDNLKAIRFARQQDGEIVLSELLNGHGKCTEHMWCESDWVNELNERSKDDRAIIVGSEVRQLCQEIFELRKQLESK